MRHNDLVEDKKAFWRFRHGQQCFEYAAKTSAQILREKWSQDHPLIYQVSVSIVVLYSRPFMNCFGIGKLDEQIVPRALLKRHRRIMDLRNKAYAHHDTTECSEGENADFRARVFLTKIGRDISIEILEPTLLEDSLSQVVELAAKLEKRCVWQLQKLIGRYEDLFPQASGVYELNLSSGSKEFFSPLPK